MRISTLERKILNCIQKDIPLKPEPFKILAKQLGVKEQVLLRKIRQLKDKGIIRNLAGHLNHRKLGFKSSLIALKIPENKVDSLARKVIRYPEVTHCYSRQGKYNLCIVFVCKKEEKMKNFLNKLTKHVGRKNILNLLTKRQFKLKTNLIV